MDKVIEVLDRINQLQGHPEITTVLKILHEVEILLRKTDTNDIDQMALYACIIKKLEQLGVPFEENRILQVDAVNGIEPGGCVDSSIQKILQEGLFFLNRVMPDPGNENLEQFKKRFREKYENREMPLALVMDTETGIGYTSSFLHQHESPLTEGLKLNLRMKETHSSVSNNEKRWIRYLVKAQQENSRCIVLTEEDIKDCEEVRAGWLPSFVVSFRTTAGT